MAKRKRLGPAMLTPDAPVGRAPEVKSVRPPIADVAGDAATTNALMELSEKISTARQEGRWIEQIPIDAIKADYLVRDRVEIDADDMAALKDSLRANGQQTAIEVVPHGPETFGLISGWRRLSALRELYLEGGLGTVLAIIRHPEDSASAYLAMVEENEIRSGLSFYERGRIVARAVDEGAYATDKDALSGLFGSVPRAKRSKIGSFVRIVRALDRDLQFPTALSERLGLALAQALGADAGLAARLRKALDKAHVRTAAAEVATITDIISPAKKPSGKPAPAGEPLIEGLSYVHHADGRMVLQGPALKDPALISKIIQAIQSIN